MRRKDVLGVVEAAYLAASNRDDWADAVTNALAVLVPDRAMAPYVLWSTSTANGGQQMEAIGGAGASPELFEINRAMHETTPPEIVRSLWSDHAGVATLSEALAALPEAASASLPKIPAEVNLADSIAMYFRGGLGRIVTLIVPLATPRGLESDERARLLRLVTHISASERLLDRRGGQIGAVLRPDGVVVHAEGEATSKNAREELRERVLQIERARCEEDGDDALDLWRGMVDGRWSLVDEFDGGGKRLFVARENPRELAVPRALDSREKQVLSLLCEGKNNKLIGYDLGFSQPRVSALVGSVLEKLGVKHRAELIDLARSMGAIAR